MTHGDRAFPQGIQCFADAVVYLVEYRGATLTTGAVAASHTAGEATVLLLTHKGVQQRLTRAELLAYAQATFVAAGGIMPARPHRIWTMLPSAETVGLGIVLLVVCLMLLVPPVFVIVWLTGVSMLFLFTGASAHPTGDIIHRMCGMQLVVVPSLYLMLFALRIAA